VTLTPRRDRSAIDQDITRLMSAQHALISIDQATELGVSDRMRRRRVQSGLWVPIQPGVFRLGGAPPTWRQRVMAGTLSAGAESLAGMRTAAALRGLDGAHAGVIDIVAPRWKRRPRGPGIVLHESQDLRPGDSTLVDGIPTATVVRLLVDSGCLVRSDLLESWLDSGIRSGRASLARVELRRRQVARRGRNGVRPIRRVIWQQVRTARVTESLFEVKLSRTVEEGGFVRPDRQVIIIEGDGRFVARADLGYPEFRTVMEADSETWHLNRRSFHDDRKRWNEMKAAGWEVLTFTWQHVHRDPAHVLGTLEAVLRRQALLLGLDYSKLRR
jgi:very-short-patch-repair endonuclease